MRGIAQKTVRLKEQIIDVTERLRDYWPLTLRQIFYRLVAAGALQNQRSKYQALSVLCSQMRKDSELSWSVMEDRTRTVSDKKGFQDQATFLKQELDSFLVGYSRCLVQQQENYVELWVEKDALSSIFYNAAWPYCIRVLTCKGHPSTSSLQEYASRAEEAQKQGRQPVVIYGGDLDPSGWQIPITAEKILKNDFGINAIFDRFALNSEQVQKYNLPHSPDAIKKKTEIHQNL